MREKSARVAQHKYSRISFLYLNLGLVLIGLEQRAARMSHIMCKSYTSRLKWKAEGWICKHQMAKILVDYSTKAHFMRHNSMVEVDTQRCRAGALFEHA